MALLFCFSWISLYSCSLAYSAPLTDPCTFPPELLYSLGFWGNCNYIPPGTTYLWGLSIHLTDHPVTNSGDVSSTTDIQNWFNLLQGYTLASIEIADDRAARTDFFPSIPSSFNVTSIHFSLNCAVDAIQFLPDTLVDSPQNTIAQLQYVFPLGCSLDFNHKLNLQLAQLPALTSLDLSTLSTPINLEPLSISGITTLGISTFSAPASRLCQIAPHLTTLLLGELTTVLPPDLLSGCKNLIALNLSPTQVTSIPDDYFHNQTRINLGLPPHLHSIGRDVFQKIQPTHFNGFYMELLTTFSLENQGLSDFECTTPSMSKISVFSLDGNQLTHVPPSNCFPNSKTSKPLVLDLSNNPIHSLPKNFLAGFSQLQSIWLGALPLQKIEPAAFSALPQLKQIVLGSTSEFKLRSSMFEEQNQNVLLDLQGEIKISPETRAELSRKNLLIMH